MSRSRAGSTQARVPQQPGTEASFASLPPPFEGGALLHVGERAPSDARTHRVSSSQHGLYRGRQAPDFWFGTDHILYNAGSVVPLVRWDRLVHSGFGVATAA